jgi:phosphate ABC transporter phosphate-binding protein
VRHTGKILTLALLSLVLTAYIGCRSAAPRLLGGGSSFIGPLMQEKWVKIYRDQKNVEIDYNVTGSGDGVKGVITDQRQFGCSDAPLTAEQIKDAGGPQAVLQIPLVVGAVVPIYNLPGLKEPLKFSGKIEKWGNEELVDLNPQLKGRTEKITAVHRSAPSGTTYIWTDYLCKASKAWKDKYKEPQTMPAWEGGEGAENNPAVAKAVATEPGTIGYVELTYALQKKPDDHFQIGLVQNADGKDFIEANLKTARAAAASLPKVPDDLSKLSFVNAPGKDSYPIVGTTWAVVKVKQTPENARLLKDFLHWAVNDGQKYTDDLHYVPLPKQVSQVADKKIDQIGGS